MGGVDGAGGFEFQTYGGVSIHEVGCAGGVIYTCVYLAPDYDPDISEPGLDDRTELRLVAHNLIVAVLDQLAWTIVPVGRQR